MRQALAVTRKDEIYPTESRMMSEVSQGPGWWQASDRKWYPPESHPVNGAPYPRGDDITKLSEHAAGNPTGAPAQPWLAPSPVGQPPAPAYVYKTPILYALGGLFFPPLVLFLMGGDRKTCLIMLCLWPIALLLIFALFVGALVIVGIYAWSVVACYMEAVKQNRAHGLA